MNNEELKTSIQNLNPMTDIRQWQKIREQVLWMNLNDPQNKEIFQLAREKGIL